MMERVEDYNNDFFEQNYTLNYSLFEEVVPLDVLLDMCKAGSVSVKDVFVSSITDQFIKYVESLQDEARDYDEIAGFLVLAATLIEIKASLLLPKSDFDDIDIDDITSTNTEALMFEIYEILSNASDKLGPKEILHRFYRNPEFTEKDNIIVLKDSTINSMVDAFKQLIEESQFFNTDEDVAKVIEKERYSVENRTKYIAEYARKKEAFLLSELFESDFSKKEKINTFLATLELVKIGLITIEQKEEDIAINLNNSKKFTELDYEEMINNMDNYL